MIQGQSVARAPRSELGQLLEKNLASRPTMLDWAERAELHPVATIEEMHFSVNRWEVEIPAFPGSEEHSGESRPARHGYKVHPERQKV